MRGLNATGGECIRPNMPAKALHFRSINSLLAELLRRCVRHSRRSFAQFKVLLLVEDSKDLD